jgi:ornithine carbamoyltransferase
LATNALIDKATTDTTVPVALTEETFAAARETLAGRDLCSIADLTPLEAAAILSLAHRVKARPEAFRYALDAKQMVMFFEKASLRTRLTFARVAGGYVTQRRTMGAGDCAADLRARDDY